MPPTGSCGRSPRSPAGRSAPSPSPLSAWLYLLHPRILRPDVDHETGRRSPVRRDLWPPGGQGASRASSAGATGAGGCRRDCLVAGGQSQGTAKKSLCATRRWFRWSAQRKAASVRPCRAGPASAHAATPGPGAARTPTTSLAGEPRILTGCASTAPATTRSALSLRADRFTFRVDVQPPGPRQSARRRRLTCEAMSASPDTSSKFRAARTSRGGHPGPWVKGYLLCDDLLGEELIRGVQVDPEGPSGQFHLFGQYRQDGVSAPVVPRQWSAARIVPHHVVCQEPRNRLHVALREGLEALAKQLFVWVRHDHPFFLGPQGQRNAGTRLCASQSLGRDPGLKPRPRRTNCSGGRRLPGGTTELRNAWGTMDKGPRTALPRNGAPAGRPARSRHPQFTSSPPLLRAVPGGGSPWTSCDCLTRCIPAPVSPRRDPRKGGSDAHIAS